MVRGPIIRRRIGGKNLNRLENSEMNRETKLIKCGDHSFAPWATTCVHVLDGTATDIVPIPLGEGGEVEHDYICDRCYGKHFIRGSDDLEDLRTVCIHCLREMLKPYGKGDVQQDV